MTTQTPTPASTSTNTLAAAPSAPVATPTPPTPTIKTTKKSASSRRSAQHNTHSAPTTKNSPTSLFRTVTLSALTVAFSVAAISTFSPHLSVVDTLQSSLLATPEHSEAVAATTSVIENTLLFALISSLVSIFLLALSYKWFNLDKKELSLPSSEIIESLTFLWVFSMLLFSLYHIITLFQTPTIPLLDFIIQQKLTLTAESANILLTLSFFFGMLGGVLANIKFFLRSNYADRPFGIDYIYHYIANPFISAAVGFLTFLMLIELNFANTALAADLAPVINPVTYLFLFFLFGFFSNTFFTILRTIASSIEDFVTDRASLLSKMHQSEPTK